MSTNALMSMNVIAPTLDRSGLETETSELISSSLLRLGSITTTDCVIIYTVQQKTST